MGLAKNIVGAGFSWVQAQNTSWAAVKTGISAAGTTQATATALTACINLVGTATSLQGVQIFNGSINDSVSVYNDNTTVTITVYPPNSGQINNLAVNTGILLPNNTEVVLKKVTSTRWIASMSA
jgi:hypothetical protein